MSARDFLEWYNNLDVGPFVEAIQKMFEFYAERGMDMFKCAISVPGLSLRYLFLTLDDGTYFSLIDKSNKDLYYKIKKNIVGGPSIVFNRYHEQNKTYIRNGPNVCKKIVGFDANALYLWALMQNMPTGLFVRRKAEQDFKPIMSQKYGAMATEWLEWEARSKGVHIVHQFNGTEKRVGTRKLPVDGFCRETNTVLNVHGCFWHVCRCQVFRNDIHPVRKISCETIRRETEENAAYIRNQGYNLIEMWECQWKICQGNDSNLRSFLESISTSTQSEKNNDTAPSVRFYN